MRTSSGRWVAASAAASLLITGAGKVATTSLADRPAVAPAASAAGARPTHHGPLLSGAWPLSMDGPGLAAAPPGLQTAPAARRPPADPADLSALEKPPAAYVLVSVPRARLWMVRDGRIAGSMRVIVGRPDHPTPAMSTEITHVILHPRWHVPQDIVRERLAPDADRTGGRSLSEAGFEVMSSWKDDAATIPATEIDWRAVAEGRLEVPVRQKPGPRNAMGRAKFVMPNDSGIYLHDTPDRSLFAADTRTRSAGCIRLEDYEALITFLIPQDLPPPRSTDRPSYVRLGTPVPIHVTHDPAMNPLQPPPALGA